MENLSKRQQPIQRAEKSPRPSMGLQHSKKTQQLGAGVDPLKNNVYLCVKRKWTYKFRIPAFHEASCSAHLRGEIVVLHVLI